jgi:hypothetical protein
MGERQGSLENLEGREDQMTDHAMIINSQSYRARLT